MTIRQYAKYTLNLFFIIAALINLAMAILGGIYYPDRLIGYDAFLYPLIYSLASMIPVWMLYSRRELTVRQLLFRKILQLLSLEVILFLITFAGSGMLKRENLPVMIGFSISVLLVYAAVDVIEWLLDLRKAKDLMKDLEQYQKQHM